MPTLGVHQCECSYCQQESDNQYKEQHRRINLLLSTLEPQQRRLYVAIEAERLGSEGSKMVSQITGLKRPTINRGIKELKELSLTGVISRVKKPSEQPRGRPRIETKYHNIHEVLEQMLDYETAGNPMKEQKWVRSSITRLKQQLREQGITVGRSTIWRILKDLGFSMKVSIKHRKGFGSGSPDRDQQFKYIALMRQEFSAAGKPIISIDTKKKELIGDFKKGGRSWRKKPLEVNEYDFPSLAVCRAVPYGIYDVTKNQGYVYVGTSGDTPEFVGDVIARWWNEEGSVVYPGRDALLILADGGGSNGCRVRAWKQQLQEKICDKLGLTVTVCHYPTRCSKWNPIERRLFSQISLNWAGKPLRTLEIMLAYIRGTNTSTGLNVKAFLQDGIYETGQKVSKKDMTELNLEYHTTCPDWNYTVRPRNSPSEALPEHS